jgi:hypothetical protein
MHSELIGAGFGSLTGLACRDRCKTYAREQR